MHGCSGGACVVAWEGVRGCSGGGMRGCSGGACMVAPGGACMVALEGVRGFPGGHAWFFGGGVRGFFDEIRSMSGRYASYWNAFLFIYNSIYDLDHI